MVPVGHTTGYTTSGTVRVQRGACQYQYRYTVPVLVLVLPKHLAVPVLLLLVLYW